MPIELVRPERSDEVPPDWDRRIKECRGSLREPSVWFAERTTTFLPPDQVAASGKSTATPDWPLRATASVNSM
jgi:hypothetical protein